MQLAEKLKGINQQLGSGKRKLHKISCGHELDHANYFETVASDQLWHKLLKLSASNNY